MIDVHSAIIVTTHDDVSVYRAPGSDSVTHVEFKTDDPHGYRRHLHHKGVERDHPLPPHEDEYYAAIAHALNGITRIVLISNGGGSSSSGGLFLREFTKRHHDIASTIIKELTLDIESLTVPQIIAAGIAELI